MTNYEHIKNMSVEEMAMRIYQGISSDPCDYCPYNFTNCCGDICNDKSNVNIVLEWLNSEVEE